MLKTLEMELLYEKKLAKKVKKATALKEMDLTSEHETDYTSNKSAIAPLSAPHVDGDHHSSDIRYSEEVFHPLVTRPAVAQSSHTTSGHITTDCRHVETLQVQESRITTSFPPPYSADPYNTAQHIPQQASWIEPITTLTDCTSDGRSSYNEHNNFRLEIPEGPIPEGEIVTIDNGVARYSTFQYPKGICTMSCFN